MGGNDRRVVVVTGGSKGLGRGLCEAFLARGSEVVFCGRGAAAVHGAAAEMGAGGKSGRILGVVADVARYDDVLRVWERAIERFGRVDVWINNAGASNVQRPFHELPASDIEAVVGANLMGTMNGVHVALSGMRAQGHGHVFTMEGFGSDGSTQPGMAIYGATKSLSPGIVVTDLLIGVYAKGDPANWRKQRWLFELIADPVDVVAPWLADRVLAGPKHGEHVAWMTVTKAILRAFQPRFYRRKLFGNRLPSA